MRIVLLIVSTLLYAYQINVKTLQNMTATTTQPKMQVEVWSDIMCPFCYIGKRHYEKALSQFGDKNNIEIVWKSFQLDSTIPERFDHKVSVYGYLAERKGISRVQSEQMHKRVLEMAETAGLHYDFEKAVVANSFKAHRVIQFAKTKNLGDKIEERLFRAYFTEGKDFGDTNTLIELGKEIGLSEAEVNEALTNDEYAYRVKQDIQEAQNIGVSGVPFFVFNRHYAVYGAQPTEVFRETLEKSFAEWRKTNPVSQMEIVNGNVCTPDGKCDLPSFKTKNKRMK